MEQITIKGKIEFCEDENKQYSCNSICGAMFGFCQFGEPKNKKQTYYCVVSKFFDGGGVKAVCYDIEAEEKPKNEQVENNLCDEYHDYFDTYDEAEAFRKSFYKA